MKFTKEQINEIVEEVAASRGHGLDKIRANLGDAFNQEHLQTAIARAEVESYGNTQVQDAQRYARFVPVDTSVNALPDTYLSKGFESFVGKGKAYSGTGGDIPLAEVVYGEQKIGFRRGVTSYLFTYDELKLASQTGNGLSSAKPAAARFSYERHMCDVAFFGEEKIGVKGLFNHDIPKVATAAKAWNTSNPQEIVKDIAEAIGLAYSKSSRYALPNTVVLPETTYNFLASTMTGVNSDVSLLDYLKRNNLLTQKGVNVQFDSDPELETAGADNGPRIAIYRKDPSALEFLISQELEFLEGQPRNLDLYVPGTYVYGGLWVKDENAIVYLDGIGG